jgi:hypothetical protein
MRMSGPGSVEHLCVVASPEAAIVNDVITIMYKLISLSKVGLILVFCFLTSVSQAQNLTPTPTSSPATDKTADYGRRRIAPTVGTGGAVGGPTGLFTIYDGKTLHERDFTFSLSYSNYHRDPGAASLAETHFTFNYGLREKIELFFNSEIYRGIKIYNPAVLSGFYLPNSQFPLASNQLGTGAAFVLAPINNRGLTGAVFRPAGNQPFVQFPFIGQPSGNFGVTGSPPFIGTLSVQATPGAVAQFPGIGSVFGSILPGIVVPPTTLTANLTQQSTLAPVYLPDAPFLNRTYGESSLNSAVIGAKVRFRRQENLTNFGFLSFYRFYADRANSQSGFNMLQRGSSPGGNRGDLGLVGFVASRIGPHANISFNAGYTHNSNPTSSLFGQKVTLLDRPDEFNWGLGIDYSYFSPQIGDYQPIFEIRGTKYFGGRTPNVFEHNPVDLLAGTRIYLPFAIPLLDNIGIGAAYRRHLNPQSNRGSNFSFSALNPLSQANGFLLQFFIGRDRIKGKPGTKSGEILPVPQRGQTALTKIILPCPANQRPRANSCPIPNPLIMRQEFTAKIVDDDGNPIPFGKDPNRELDEAEIRWVAPANTRVVPEQGSRTALWDLTGAGPGLYELKALYPDYVVKNRQLVKVGDIELKFTMPVEACDCEPIVVPIICPTSVSVSSNAPSVLEGTPATFTANVSEPPPGVTVTYQWQVDRGQISGRSDMPSVVVDTSGLGGEIITATVTLGGLDPTCKATARGDVTTARKEVPVEPTPAECKIFDRYGPIMYNDEKARLDNFAISLNLEPGTNGYIVAFGGGTLDRNIGTRINPVRGTVTSQYRIDRATRYLIEDRGLLRQRLSFKNAGNANNSEVDLYLCPANKEPPLTPDPAIQNESPLNESRVVPVGSRAPKRSRVKRSP